MIKIGITGAICGGKSSAAVFFQKAGVRMIDADLIARELVSPESALLQKIIEVFGVQYLNSDGSLNRAALAELIFADTESRKKLEAILHPKIMEVWEEHVRQCYIDKVEFTGMVIPLLFEIGAKSKFDVVICVACSDTVRIERAALRGWSADHLKLRDQSQIPIRYKIENSDFVIWNDGSLETLENQVNIVLMSISKYKCFFNKSES